MSGERENCNLNTTRMEHKKYLDEQDKHILTNTVKAGKRTYFIDVKETSTQDYFLTITESRKKSGADGTSIFERHKIFLYKEDFMKFEDGLAEVIEFVKSKKPEYFEQQAKEETAASAESKY